MATIEEVTARYIQLRDEKEALAKQHANEMKPIGEKMAAIESWFMAKMQQDGVDSYKSEAGTAFKATQTSVTCADPVSFRSFTFAPVVDQLVGYLQAVGIDGLSEEDRQTIANILQTAPLWGMMDVRVGKKGVQEFLEETKQLPPGVVINQVSTVQVRRK